MLKSGVNGVDDDQARMKIKLSMLSSYDTSPKQTLPHSLHLLTGTPWCSCVALLLQGTTPGSSSWRQDKLPSVMEEAIVTCRECSTV